MICYRVMPVRPVKGFCPTHCKKYENAVREQIRMEYYTGVEWVIDQTEL